MPFTAALESAIPMKAGPLGYGGVPGAWRKWMRLLVVAGLLPCAGTAYAQQAATADPATSAARGAVAQDINVWLARLHEAAKKRAYVGTFVASAGGSISSAKIWHVCDGNQQIERVDMLSGAPRSTFRHNDQVVTFLPDSKVVRHEKRESLGLFPEFLVSVDERIGDFYAIRPGGVERVAGVEADFITLVPKDNLRFGYRVWTERKQGLVVKLQTLDSEARVLAQAAFSELQIDAPVKADQLVRMMGKVEGYRVEKPVLVKTTASAEGWDINPSVPGFRSISCYKRPVANDNLPSSKRSGSVDESVQWIFSDGLASVSVFVEPFDRSRHDKEAHFSIGATQTLTRQLNQHWLTVMGEVPLSTLRLFAKGMVRKQ